MEKFYQFETLTHEVRCECASCRALTSYVRLNIAEYESIKFLPFDEIEDLVTKSGGIGRVDCGMHHN